MTLTLKPSIFSRLKVELGKGHSAIPGYVAVARSRFVRQSAVSVQKIQEGGWSCATIGQLGISTLLRYPQHDVANREAGPRPVGWDVVAYVALIILIA